MIEIYVDGACKTSTLVGGWAFIVVENDIKIHREFDNVKDTTNNRMEITACIKALDFCVANNIKQITLISDSMYVIGTMSRNWKRNKNHDLWVIMDDLSNKVNVTYKHIKGHSGDKWNELCDTLAVEASNVIFI